MFRKIFIAGLLAVLFSAAAFGQEKKLVTNAPAVVAKGRSFKVEYTIAAQPQKIVAPTFENFQLIGNGTSQSTSIGSDGIQRAEFIYTYVLVAPQAGNFIIPAATVEVDGKTYTSQPKPIEVVDEGTDGAAGQQSQTGENQNQSGSMQSAQVSGEELFLRAIPDKVNVFRGEPVRVRFKLYSQETRRLNSEGAKTPSFNGFWQQALDVSQYQHQTESYNSRVYNTFIIAEYLLYPTQSGTLKIDPFTLNLVIQELQRPTSQSIWDDFMGGFPEVKEIRKSVSSPAVTITVRELPANAPESFTGAVGEFAMTSAEPDNKMYVNSAASFKIKISGTGNIPLMQGPKVEMPTSFEQHNSKMTEDTKVSPAGISGSRQFEFPFIARAEGDFRLEPVRFSYFNPQTEQYVTLSTRDMNLTVIADTTGGPTSSLGIVGGLSKEELKILGKDIRFIKYDSPKLKQNGKTLINSPLYYIIAGALIAVSAFLLVYLQRRIRQMRDAALVRGKKANKVVLARLKAADKYMNEGNRHKFHDEMLKALWGYLSDKLNIPVANLTKENVREKLLKRNIPAELTTRYTDLISECEYAQYSPAESSSMQDKYTEAVDVITKLESYIKR